MKNLTVVLLCIVGAAGCSSTASGTSSGSSGPSGSSGGSASLNATARQDLAACIGGKSDGAIDDSLEITADFEQSCHELVVCGGLAAQLTVNVVELFAQAVLGATSDSGLKFDGKGSYESAPGTPGTNMKVTFRLPKDTKFGKAGDVIPFDLTKVDAYFKGASLSADGSISTGGLSVKVKVTYSDLGPAFELLGLTAQPGPGTVTLDAKEMSRAIGAIKVSAVTHVDDKQGHASFVYDMTTPDTTLGAVDDGGALAFKLDGASGARAEQGQTLESALFNVAYVGGKVGKLDGTISFAVKGGALPHKATFTYAKSNEPTVKLACP